MELNRIVCVGVGTNVGFGSCVVNPKNFAGAFLVPPDLALGASEIASLQATLQSAASADNAANRIYPIHGSEAMTNNTEAKVIQSLGFGGKYPVREGDYDLMFQYINGALCLHKSLRALNGKGRSFLFYDNDGLLIGWKVGNTLKGIP